MADPDIITGTGTLWSTAILPGDIFWSKGISVPIKEVISDTSIRLTMPWPGPPLAAGSKYSIVKNSGLRHAPTEMVARVRDLLNRLRPFDAAAPVFSVLEFGVNTPPSASDGDRYVSGTEPTGQWTGHPNEIIEKTSTGWLFRSPEHGWHIIDEATNAVRAWTGSTWTGQIGLGASLIFVGQWSGSENYVAGNVVIHAGRAWVAVDANSNSEPGFESEDWTVFVDVGEDGGAFTLRYQFDDDTTETAPAPGRVKFNAAPGSATILRVSIEDVHGNAWGALIGSIDTATDSIQKGKVRVVTKGDATRQIIANVASATLVGSTHYNLAISAVQVSAAALQDDAEVLFTFQERGDKGEIGSTGATGPRGFAGGGAAIPYLFSTNTGDMDPGNGRLRLNNSTQSSATEIYADQLNSGGDSVADLIDAIAAGTSTVKATGRLFDAATAAKWIAFNVTGVTTKSGYRALTIEVTGSSASTPFTNNDPLILDWSPTGDKGDTGETGEKGDTGDTGSGIQPDFVVDTLPERDAYDDEPEQTIVLVASDGDIYIRSGAAGNWLGPVAVGGASDASEINFSNSAAELPGEPTTAQAAVESVAGLMRQRAHASTDWTGGTSSTSWVESGLSAALPATLAKVGNKVLIRCSLILGGSAGVHFLKLRRGSSTFLPSSGQIANVRFTDTSDLRHVTFEWVDEPDAVDVETYYLMWSVASGGSLYFNRQGAVGTNRGFSSMTLEEIHV